MRPFPALCFGERDFDLARHYSVRRLFGIDGAVEWREREIERAVRIDDWKADFELQST